MASWKFYGRTHELATLSEMLGRDRWFFAKVAGRRRIGKTSLIREALRGMDPPKPIFYVQIPDSEAAGVLSAVNDALDTFAVPKERFPRPRDLNQLVGLWEGMIDEGYIVVLDEFQYFNRKRYDGFCSLLQAAVDRLSAKSESVSGGLIVLGSLYTEMMALLDDRAAPLYNRVTDAIELSHLDIASILAILRDHADTSPERLLFLWSLFEGVPKYYRDCFEQNELAAERRELLRHIFFESSSPLRTEAQNWFLRELRGRYDVVLKFIARHPGRTHNEIVQEVREGSGDPDAQVGGYLKHLIQKFRLIEKKQPIFAKPSARRGRYYVTDNFLRSWLAALSNPVSAIAFRPVDQLVREADERLKVVEGHSLEKLAGQLYEEQSRLGVGDFPLSSRIQGYWDRTDTEIDLVAVSESNTRIRFASCKRSPAKLVADVNTLKAHVDQFLEAMPRYQSWTIEYAGIAPRLNADQRRILGRHDVIPQDLNDLISELT